MSDDALPLCACVQYYDSHHPECPARRAYEAALLKLDAAELREKGCHDHESAAVERTVTVWNLQDSRSVQLCGGCGDAIDGDHICVSRHAAQELERLRTDISTLRAEIAELKARRVGVRPGDGLIGGCGGRESE